MTVTYLHIMRNVAGMTYTMLLLSTQNLRFKRATDEGTFKLEEPEKNLYSVI